MTTPLITIGITCYAEGDWLLECWESVLAQTDDRWAAALVMDGTTDKRTREVFQQIRHPKLRKFAMPQNAGPYPTRNKAFEMTETPYHFYLDGDDQLERNSIADVLKTFAEHPDAGFVYGDYQAFGTEANVWRTPERVSPEIFEERQPIPGACAYSKALWQRLGGFAPELARGNADHDFFIGAMEAAERDLLTSALEEKRPIRRAPHAADHDFFIGAMETGAMGYHCGSTFYRVRVGNPGKVSSSYNRTFHKTHEIMVQRHPGYFRDGVRKRRFLAAGYKHAAHANLAAGDFRQGRALAWAGLCQCWTDIDLWRYFLRGSLPKPVFKSIRYTYRLTRKFVL